MEPSAVRLADRSTSSSGRAKYSNLMAGLAESPFAALTIVVAPAILTNASSVLCLGTGNRIARVVDRTRALRAELASLPVESERRPSYMLQL